MRWSLCCAVLVAILGCGKKDEESVRTDGAAPSSTYVSWSEAESLSTPPSASPEPDTADVAVESRFTSSPGTVYSTVDAGYPILVDLATPLSSRSAHAGDMFRGTLVELVVSEEGHTVVPVGAPVVGRVTAVTGSMPGENSGLTLTLIEMDGRTIHTRPLTLNGTGAVTPGPADSVIGAGATDTTTGVPVGESGGRLDLPAGQRLRFALANPLRVSTRFGNQP